MKQCLSTMLSFCYFISLVLVLTEGSSECAKPLGMQNGNISDHQLRASSRHGKHRAQFARLNVSAEGKAWCPNQTKYKDGKTRYSEYLEIRFGRRLLITAIEIQGRPPKNEQFVQRFRVNYTDSKYRWKQVVNGTEVKDFLGCENGTCKRYFDPALFTNTFRIIPLVHGNVNPVCLRLELYGCQDYWDPASANQATTTATSPTTASTSKPSTTVITNVALLSATHVTLVSSGALVLVLLVIIACLARGLRKSQLSLSTQRRSQEVEYEIRAEQGDWDIRDSRVLSGSYCDLRLELGSQYTSLTSVDTQVSAQVTVRIDDELDSAGYVKVV